MASRSGAGHLVLAASIDRKKGRERLRLTVGAWDTTSDKAKSWEDAEGAKIEGQLTEIVAELIVTGEAYYRASVQAHYEWRVQRKAELEEEARKQREAEERRERERLAKLEKERVEPLFNEVTNRWRANDLRAFVSAARAANKSISEHGAVERLEQCAAAALADADRIDPI